MKIKEKMQFSFTSYRDPEHAWAKKYCRPSIKEPWVCNLVIELQKDDPIEILLGTVCDFLQVSGYNVEGKELILVDKK